jgi:putative Ca2+/H+ antiporter (TMEM165/GDT1 family)
MTSILLPFFTVALAELLDKSQLTLLFLSSKTKKHLAILLGSLAAFALVDGIAIVFGSWIAIAIPVFAIKIVSASVFIFFGIQTFRNKENKDETKKEHMIEYPFISAFSLIFLAEWGDKTQLASASFAGIFPPVQVFIGVMLAMSFLSFIAVFAGKYLLRQFSHGIIHSVAGVVYILVGISFLMSM